MPALAKAYTSPDPRLRFAVVRALADIEDRRGTQVLDLARQDPDRIVRRVASEALKDRHDDDDDQ